MQHYSNLGDSMTDEKKDNTTNFPEYNNDEYQIKNVNINKLIKLGKISADALSLHHLLHKIPNNNMDEKMKIISGITGYGVGYLIGPQVHKSYQHIKNGELQEIIKQPEIITAAGGLVGVITGALIINYAGQFHSKNNKNNNTDNSNYNNNNTNNSKDNSNNNIAQNNLNRLQDAKTQEQYSNLANMTATGASIAWLAYSISSKGSYEEKLRHSPSPTMALETTKPSPASPSAPWAIRFRLLSWRYFSHFKSPGLLTSLDIWP